MLRYKFIILLVSIIYQAGLKAQVGGDNIYEFLNLSHSARITSLGDYIISVKDKDINLALANPGLLNNSMNKSLSFSHNIHFAGLQSGYLAYGFSPSKTDLNFHSGIQYIQYNHFKLTDEFGNIQGDFSASEYAFTAGISKSIQNKLNLGINTKVISSRFESYQSTGIAFDLGAHYVFDSSALNIGVVIKNIGLPLTTYTDRSKEKLPFDIQVGISKRLAHLPFRFSVVSHDIHRWNILYDDPDQENSSLFGPQNEPGAAKIFTDNLFRHLVFGGEFLLGKNEQVRLRVAYNHQRRQELGIPNYFSFSGFSAGFGIRVKQFYIDYGLSTYHISGGTHHFSIGTNIDRFKKQGIL